jgi:hypothetical protein
MHSRTRGRSGAALYAAQHRGKRRHRPRKLLTPYDDLVARSAVTLRLDHQLSKQVALRAGLTSERYRFGTTGVAAIVEIAN